MDRKIVDLILELKTLNPSWGGQKISHELAKVGYHVCKKTVLKYLEINGLNSPVPRSRITWTEFLNNHKFKIGIDFTSLISILGKQLFIFVMIDLDSRKLVFISATFNPNAEWITQQFRNAFLEFEHYPSLCICDNDQIFKGWFEEMLKENFSMALKRTPYKSPQKNGRTERFHLSLKNEAFSNVVPINLRHTIKLCRKYQDYYNFSRPHQGIDGNIPDKTGFSSKTDQDFLKKEHLSGRIISFEPALDKVS